MENLTDKERQFCVEYAVTLNGAEAARRCGYAAASARVAASRLRRKPEVRALCDELIAQREQDTRTTAESILARLDKLATWCMVPVPVLDKHGREIGEKPMDAAAANRALELLGKNLGLWREVVEQTTDQEISLTWSKPLAAMAEEGEDDELPPEWASEKPVQREHQARPQLPEPEPADQQPKKEQPQPNQAVGVIVI